MTTKLTTGIKTDSMRKIQKLMKENSITGVPILDNKRLIGVVSINDILSALDGAYIDEPVDKHMTRKLIVLEADMPLSFAISYFDKYQFRRFPVLNSNKELVGMVSSRDILTCLLFEINKEIENLESKIVHPGINPAERGHIHKEFITSKFNFETAGKASTEIKKILKKIGLDRKIIRRIAVAAYEMEMNQVVHSYGGKIICLINDEKVKIIAADSGPGIKDVEKALEEGFSTANDWIRSLGFGAGMGLPNIKRVSDEFTIQSQSGSGTTVASVIYINKGE